MANSMPKNLPTCSLALRCGPRCNTGAADRSRQQRGFTLIEVIVALTITGFLLGGLFALVGGSKQLSWRAEDVLVRATQQRTAWNFALLDNEYAELEPILDDEFYTVRELDDLEAPVDFIQHFESLNELIALREEGPQAPASPSSATTRV